MKFLYSIFTNPALIFFLFCPNLGCCKQSIFIYRDFGHKGDENQARGVVEAYSHLKKDIEVMEFNIGEEEKLTASVKDALTTEKDKPIILSVGEKTVSTYADLLPFEGAITVHLCHMVTTNHSKLIGKADFIAVPTHALGDFAKIVDSTKTQLIETIGVAHNHQIGKIEHVYGLEKSKLPESNSYFGVILAGDAPTPDNKTQLFTEINACELARYIAKHLDNRHLLIINGPRTGKYNPTTYEEIQSVHRDGKRDNVTQAFLEELEKCKISPNQYTLFDFQFGSSSPDMDLLLGAIRVKKGEILVAGESTSSISESIDVLPTGDVIVYETTSMNQAHKTHVASELKEGRIKYLKKGYKELIENKKMPNKNKRMQNHSAAETIALVLAR